MLLQRAREGDTCTRNPGMLRRSRSGSHHEQRRTGEFLLQGRRAEASDMHGNYGRSLTVLRYCYDAPATMWCQRVAALCD